MSEGTLADVIVLLNSKSSEEREQGLKLATTIESVTIDGSSLKDLGGNILEKFPKLTSVTLTVGEHTESHLAAFVGHLQNNAVAAENIQIIGDFDENEWITAGEYSWTKYFEVDEIEAYISECESGSRLQCTFGPFTLASLDNYAELSNILAQLPTGLSGGISISRSNDGGSIYSCTQSPLKTVEFSWEDMNEEYSEFDCDDWDQYTEFTKIISEAGLSLCQGFFYNEWSGNQVNQEEWWIGDFEFPSVVTITLSWTS